MCFSLVFAKNKYCQVGILDKRNNVAETFDETSDVDHIEEGGHFAGRLVVLAKPVPASVAHWNLQRNFSKFSFLIYRGNEEEWETLSDMRYSNRAKRRSPSREKKIKRVFFQ